jgi:hypothetical protein
MGVLALILGILGGLCVIAGVSTAVGVLAPLTAELTPVLWLGLGGVLFVAAILCLLARTPSAE